MVNPLLSSLNSGEFSPRIEARVEFERYPNAAKRLRNMWLHPQGGATRRPGTRFISELKDSASRGALIPFEFAENDAYMIEAGDSFMRFYRRHGRIEVPNTNAFITNGSFTSDISGWYDISTGGASVSHDATNLRLTLNGVSGGLAWTGQGVAVTAEYVNVQHVLSFIIYAPGGAEVAFRVGTAYNSADILADTLLGDGYHSIGFIPTTATFYIQFYNINVPARACYIDDVGFLAGEPMELVSTYTADDLPQLQAFQSADIVYITHPDYPVAKLERRGVYSWSLVEVFWEDGPYLDVHNGDDLAPSQLVPNADFDNGVQGWHDASQGSGFIAYNESGEFAELDPGATGGGNVAVLRNNGIGTVSGKKHVVHVLIVASGPVTVNIGYSGGGAAEYIATTQQPGWFSYEFTSVSASLHIEFRHPTYEKGRAGVGGCRVYNEDTKLLEASATTGLVSVTALGFAPFVASDAGRLLRLEFPGQEPGYGVITGISSSSVAVMLVLRKIPSTSPTESWRFGSFGGAQQYPKVISFFDGRTVLANTALEPNTVWFSQSGQLENMRPDSFVSGNNTQEDDDAINITLRSTKLNPIFWMNGAKSLMLGTAGGEWVVASSNAVVTPTDVSAKQHSEVACADMKAVAINQTILFADKARRRIHDLAFNLNEDTFLATDMTILADHMLKSPVEQVVYQRSPSSLVWCRRADGRIGIMAYNKQHQVLGWSHVIVGGTFGDTTHGIVEDLATIPGVDSDEQVFPSDERTEVWAIVKRTINGETKRYIEVFEGVFEGPLREDYDTELEWREAVQEAQEDAFYVDSGLTYEGVATETITGLDHLEGEEVCIFAEGRTLQRRTVADGTIVLNAPVECAHIGLPYKHSYESLKIVVNAQQGTSVNKIKIITSLGVIVLDTAQLTITTVEYDEDGRRLHDLYDVQFLRETLSEEDILPLYTGEKHVTTEGSYSRDVRIYIEGDDPSPCTILAFAPQMEVRDV